MHDIYTFHPLPILADRRKRKNGMTKICASIIKHNTRSPPSQKHTTRNLRLIQKFHALYKCKSLLPLLLRVAQNVPPVQIFPATPNSNNAPFRGADGEQATELPKREIRKCFLGTVERYFNTVVSNNLLAILISTLDTLFELLLILLINILPTTSNS